MNHRTTDQRGFTLLEIMAVVVVTGILATVTVVGTTRLVRSTRLAGATNTVETDVRYARSLATSQRRNVEIHFVSGGYSIYVPAASDTVLRRVNPSGVTCSASGTATFFAWGLNSPTTISLATSERTNTLAVAANGTVSRY